MFTLALNTVLQTGESGSQVTVFLLHSSTRIRREWTGVSSHWSPLQVSILTGSAVPGAGAVPVGGVRGDQLEEEQRQE